MGVNTKIDWCDASWNPVTGCRHDCEYCFAKKIAHRFDGKEWRNDPDGFGKLFCPSEQPIPHGCASCDVRNDCGFTLDEPRTRDGKKEPYPYGFTPTFYRYRLDEPQKWKKPRNIFVCSMGDLFGDWVPTEWMTAAQVADIKRGMVRFEKLRAEVKKELEA